jgi:hypothetical protein
MSQGNAEAAAVRQDSRDLSDRAVQVEDILEAHEGGHEICGAIRERKLACVTEHDRLPFGLMRHPREGRRCIDGEDAVASLVQESP